MSFKGFRVNNEVLALYEKLKKFENINSDSDFFSKMLTYIEKIQNQNFVSVELLNQKQQALEELQQVLQEKEKELKALYIKLGELQGELNIYKQQALPRKSFWKRLFGG